jgi:hypothetical protein
MPRSRPKVYAHRRHKKVLKFTKGQLGSKHLLFRRANEAMLKSLFYAFHAIGACWCFRASTSSMPMCTTQRHCGVLSTIAMR